MRNTLDAYARKVGRFLLAIFLAIAGLLVWAITAFASLVVCKWIFPGEEWELAEIFRELATDGAYRRGPRRPWMITCGCSESCIGWQLSMEKTITLGEFIRKVGHDLDEFRGEWEKYQAEDGKKLWPDAMTPDQWAEQFAARLGVETYS